MKKKSLAILLPVAAGVALAGTGFGAWVFTSGASETVTGCSIELADAIGYENLSATWVDNNNMITLDSENNNNVAPDITSLGMTISYTANFENGGVGTYTDVSFTTSDTNDTYSYSSNTGTRDYSYTVTVSNSLSTYLTVTLSKTSGDSTLTSSGNTYTLKYTASAKKDVSDTLAVNFAWATDMAPTTIDKYTAFRNALAAATKPITFKVVMGA